MRRHAPAHARPPARQLPSLHAPSRRSVLKGLCAAPLAGLVAGCGAGEYVASLFSSDPRPSTITWSLETTPGVNPDITDRPSPIWVRLYQLRSIGVFGGADFTALFERDIDVLGAEMLQRYEYVMTPNHVVEPQKQPVTLHEDTRFIGVVAAYHDINRAHWRDMVAVNHQDHDYALKVDLDRIALRLSLEQV